MSQTLVRTSPAVGEATPAVADFLALLKPRVMSLVVFTGLTGLVVAPGTLHPVLAAVAVLCIAVGAGASGAINMWFDADIDRVMERTRQRPIPAGRVAPEDALAFGVILSGGSIGVMGLAVNWAAAALLALTIGFYVFIYTMWLKRRTPQNIVIGGAAGAFPPMIGWAAVTGDIGWPSLVLFALIFLWTPPHFWALALWRAGDYARAGVPMLPVVSGVETTRLQIVVYAVATAAAGVAPAFVGLGGAFYLPVSALLGAVFVGLSVAVFRDRAPETNGHRAAKRLFGFSILYLFLLFALMLAHGLVAGA